MGGTIGVESQEGRGSSFWFTAVLGLAPPSADAGQKASPRRNDGFDAHGGIVPNCKTARILVAEDNPVNREVAVALLRKLGYSSSAVTNGAEAVEAVKSGDYNLVLMDCEMPVMDGFDATRRIRGSIHTSIPIVALTANAMPVDRDRCLREGMTDYLAKPVDLRKLADVLDKWLPAN
jgi:two-component system, sensor histidine kinase